MLQKIATDSRYKFITLTSTTDVLCVRLLHPCAYATNEIGVDRLLSTSDLLNYSFFPDKEASKIAYRITSQCFINKTDEVIKGGNHVLIYTTPDLAANNIIGYGLKSQVKNLAGLIIIAELFVTEDNQQMNQIQKIVYCDSKGFLYTNEDADSHLISTNDLNVYHFDVSLKGPKCVNTNQSFVIEINMMCDGVGVTGNIVAEVLAGYAPSRIIHLENGKGVLQMTSLFVQDCVIVRIKDQTIKIEVNNDQAK